MMCLGSQSDTGYISSSGEVRETSAAEMESQSQVDNDDDEGEESGMSSSPGGLSTTSQTDFEIIKGCAF